MTEPRLTPTELVLLNQVVADRGAELRELVLALTEGRALSASGANALRDAIGDELAESGIDEDFGAVNERGRDLDALIDRVGAMGGLHEASLD